jgi:hypothetical protein
MDNFSHKNTKLLQLMFLVIRHASIYHKIFVRGSLKTLIFSLLELIIKILITILGDI